MAKELTIDVNARLTVSDEMASRCLRLLEMWQNDNPDKMIIRDTVRTTEGVRFVFYIRDKMRGEQERNDIADTMA